MPYAGLDFLTILGAHEGEGLVVDSDAEVAGSRSALMADKGQKVRTTGAAGPSLWVCAPSTREYKTLDTGIPVQCGCCGE